jgi:NAD(P)-dependent dehydrogenase (short-subunit alcohol dehydrogenase family)
MIPVPMTTLSASFGSGRRPRLKSLHEQVVVILGASSGIGRESALRFAAKGAKVIVAARSEPGLRSLVEEIEHAGGEAAYAVSDIADFGQVERVATLAVERFGRIDTWVNAAAVGVYATIEDVSLDDFRRVTDVNIMGYVHGVKAAMPHLRREGRGAIIFVSSVESTIAMPFQGVYAMSKHAIQGLAETLRRELRIENVPISVTSIKPGVISTPFYDNALSAIGFKPTGPPPAYDPALVADCVVFAARHPVRDVYVGGAGRAAALAQMFTPRAVDAVLGALGIVLQRTDEAPGDNALYAPREHDNRVEGEVRQWTIRTSPYTWLQTRPRLRAVLKTLVVAGAGGVALRRGHSR